MRLLITGSEGFIGKNLRLRLSEFQGFEVNCFDRSNSLEALKLMVDKSDAIIHLAGVNRPKHPIEFNKGNAILTEQICHLIKQTGRNIPLMITSSIQVELDNPYGLSKRAAEDAVWALAKETGNTVVVHRLPNVFGKWSRPNYNSVVATFCHNIANDLPIQIHDPDVALNLVYVDDVVDEFINALDGMPDGLSFGEVRPVYSITLGELALQIESFKNCRGSLIVEQVGSGLIRALYSTYVSYLPPEKFSYDLPKYGDERGVFVEMLKTHDSGQFSYFTAHPGVTRGGHYHHTKTEKFLVIKGHARFGFRHMLTNQVLNLEVKGDRPQVVESVPGWSHNITNIGNDEMVVMLWANEIFERDRPDTVVSKV